MSDYNKFNKSKKERCNWQKCQFCVAGNLGQTRLFQPDSSTGIILFKAHAENEICTVSENCVKSDCATTVS